MRPRINASVFGFVVVDGVRHQLDVILRLSAKPAGEDLQSRVDFALAFVVVHEMPNASTLFRDLGQALKPGARLLVAEPVGHVSAKAFDETLVPARSEGFVLESQPAIRRSRAAVLVY
jgi:hypothetical protein